MSKTLRDLFKDTIFPNLSKERQQRIRPILECAQPTNNMEHQFLNQVQTLLGFSFYLIVITQDDSLKQDDYKCFYLQTTKWVETNMENIIDVDKEVVIAYKIENQYNLVETFTEQDTCDIRISLFISSKLAVFTEIGINLLMTNDALANSTGFITNYFNINSKNSHGKGIFQILYEKENFGAIDFLLQSECYFPFYREEQEIPQVQKLIKSRDEFHDFIKNNRREEIEKYLQNNPNFKYYFNKNNNSACATAIEEKKHKMFNFLNEQGLIFTDYEFLKLGILEYLRLNELPHESDVNRKLRILTSVTMTRQKLDNPLSPEEIYETLSQITDVDLIVQVLCKTRPLTIVLDYQEENVSRICPYSVTARGLFDSMLNRIFVSGGGGNEQMFGTTAHEMTHLAMNLIYENSGKPYSVYDKERETMFDTIVEEIRNKKEEGLIKEPIIKWVYDCYKEPLWHAELIVRYNHILANYGIDKGTEILKTQTPELFGFYNKYVKPDIENYLRRHFNEYDISYIPPFYNLISRCRKYFKEEILLELATEMCNDFKESIVIKTDNVTLTCLKLFQCITRENSKYNIKNSYMIDSKTFFDNQQQAASNIQHYELLIIADTCNDKKSQIWATIDEYIEISKKQIIFVLDNSNKLCSNNALKKTDSFMFSDFDRNSQESIINEFKVNFQGKNELKLTKLMKCNFDNQILNKIFSAKFISDFINEEYPLIGPELSNPSLYISRLFHINVYSFIELFDQLVNDEKIQFLKCENFSNELIEQLNPGSQSRGSFILKKEKTATLKKMLTSRLDYDRSKLEQKKFTREKQILIFTENNKAKSIMIIEDCVIFISNFTDSALQTFDKNDKSFNINWFHKYDDYFVTCETFESSDVQRNIFTRKESFSEIDLLSLIQRQKIVLIAGTAGMGKSTTMEKLSNRFVGNNSSHWAPVIKLNYTYEILEKEKLTSVNCLEFLIKLLAFKSPLEIEVFKYCCINMNNVHLFLDGADEISPTHTKKIIELINALSKTNIKHIFVSVRMNVKPKFEKELNTRAFEIQPFKYWQQIECFKAFWGSKKAINVDEKAAGLINNLYELNEFLDNPLHISMLAEYYEDKTLTNSEKISLMQLYDEVIEKKMEITFKHKCLVVHKNQSLEKSQALEKSNLNTQLKMASVIVLLEEEEIKYFLNEIEKDKYDQKFIKEIESYTVNEGIIDGVNQGKPNFIHRIYAEYFFARFLINYEGWKLESESFFYDNILVDQRFDMVRQFLNSYDENNSSSIVANNLEVDATLTKQNDNKDKKIEILSSDPEYFQTPSITHKAVFQNVNEGNLKIVKKLLQRGFKLDTQNCWNEERFCDETRKREKIETVKYLLNDIKDIKLELSISDSFHLLRIAFLMTDNDLTKSILKHRPVELKLNYKITDSSKFIEKRPELLKLWEEAERMLREKSYDSEILNEQVKKIDEILSIIYYGNIRPRRRLDRNDYSM